MKNNGLKNAKAITLIAMVVTIIVLLILAGVSIAVLTGENGIINRTTEAKTTSKIAEVEEEARLIYTDYLIGNRAHGTALADLETIYNYDKKNFTMKEDTQRTETVNGIKTKINETEIDLTSETPSTDTFTFTSDDTNTQTQTINVSKDSTSSNGKKYYAVIEGKDYEMSITNGVVYVSRTPTAGGQNSGATLTLKTPVVSGDDILTATLDGNNVVITKKTGVTTGMATITITGTINGIDYTKVAKVSIKSYASNTTKVGQYADVDGDGTIDGIIFADLAVGNQNTSGSNGKGSGLGFEYSIPTVSTGLKQYETATDSQNIEYLRAATAGTDRFYVVALSNASNSTMTWYSNASGYMDASDTSTDFGTGKANSKTIIQRATEATNSSGYRALGSGDMWYLFTGDLSNWTADMKSWWASSGYQATKDHSNAGWTDLLKKGWFVPSKGEFAAMKGELSSTARSSAGLTSYYWSSSQSNANDAWCADFRSNSFNYYSVGSSCGVRLATTF